MTVSFPAGIIRVLTENPNPSALSFRLKNLQPEDDIVINKQILVELVIPLYFPTANADLRLTPPLLFLSQQEYGSELKRCAHVHVPHASINRTLATSG